jgi:EamA-like transporter family
MAVWGLNFVVIEVGLDTFPPLLFATLRFVVVVVPAVFLVGPPRVSWRWVVPIGLTLGAGQFGLVFTSMHLGMPAGLSSLVLQAQAAFTLVFAAALLREVVHIRQVFGLTLAFTGVVLVGSDLDQTAPPLAFALCLGGAAMWGLGNVVMRKARPPDVFNVMVWAGVVAVVPLFALSMLIEGPRTAVAAGRTDTRRCGRAGVRRLPRHLVRVPGVGHAARPLQGQRRRSVQPAGPGGRDVVSRSAAGREVRHGPVGRRRPDRRRSGPQRDSTFSSSTRQLHPGK